MVISVCPINQVPHAYGKMARKIGRIKEETEDLNEQGQCKQDGEEMTESRNISKVKSARVGYWLNMKDKEEVKDNT